MPDEIIQEVPKIKEANMTKKYKLMNFRADEQFAKEIIGYAVKHQINKSKAMRELIQKGLEKQPNDI